MQLLILSEYNKTVCMVPYLDTVLFLISRGLISIPITCTFFYWKGIVTILYEHACLAHSVTVPCMNINMVWAENHSIILRYELNFKIKYKEHRRMIQRKLSNFVLRGIDEPKLKARHGWKSWLANWHIDSNYASFTCTNAGISNLPVGPHVWSILKLARYVLQLFEPQVAQAQHVIRALCCDHIRT